MFMNKIDFKKIKEGLIRRIELWKNMKKKI
jgi:hypothetical protein